MTDQPENKKNGFFGRLSEIMQTAATLLQSHSDDPTRSPLDPMTSKAEFDAIQEQIEKEGSEPARKTQGPKPR